MQGRGTERSGGTSRWSPGLRSYDREHGHTQINYNHRDLHVDNLLQVTLLEQRQESSSNQVGAGDISLECRLEVRPFLVSFFVRTP